MASPAKKQKAEKKGGKGVRLKKVSKQIPVGKAVIQASFNTTRVTITDRNGNTLAWETAGKQGFKGAKKGTPFAAQAIAKSAAESARDVYGMSELIEVRVKGVGQGRDSAIRALRDVLVIKNIIDVTPLPHNGVRESGERRV